MKSLDTTRLDKAQLELLSLILSYVTDKLPAASIGKRMHLSNLTQKNADRPRLAA